MDTDKPYKMLNSVVKDIVDYNEMIYNKIDIIRSISLDDILKVRNDIITDNYSFIIGMPK